MTRTHAKFLSMSAAVAKTVQNRAATVVWTVGTKNREFRIGSDR
jgi:hypothetical protein